MEIKGKIFQKELQEKIKDKFYYVDFDSQFGKRLFFDNSGGALRLKSAVEARAEIERYPDCPDRNHNKAKHLNDLVFNGTRDIISTIFGAKSGALITELTASQTMFYMVELIMENIPGTNAVVSVLEHPSAFDAVEYNCKRFGKELRVIKSDSATGSISPDEVVKLVDENTCLLSVMSASNVTGAVMDIETIVKKVRKIKPDLFILSDAVQHAPHGVLDVEKLGIDGMNIAPYKMFGVRGCGYAWISDRMAALPHRKLIGKEQNFFALGTQTPGNFAAMTAVIDYICEIGKHFSDSVDRRMLYIEGMNRIKLHERALLYRLLEGTKELSGLRYIDGVTVFADALDLTSRDLIVAMGINGMDVCDAVLEYEKRGIIVCDRSNKSMYAKRIVESIGIEGAIRVSPLHCHSVDDIDRFLQVTVNIANNIN